MEVTPPSYREFKAAEGRIKESLWLRCAGLAYHAYPKRRRDLRVIKSFVDAYGLPPEGGLRGWVWWLFKRAKKNAS